MNESPIVSQQLNISTVAQLQNAAYKPWETDFVRKSVADLIQVTNGHIIINPNSVKELGTGIINIFESGAKQAVYGVFDLILGTYATAEVGVYELVGSIANVAYRSKAQLFMNTEGKGWTAYRVMDGKYLPMDLPQDNAAAETMRLKYEWLDLVLKGAYIDIDVSTYAPQMYDYFGSLLAMTPSQAQSTIKAHMANKEERRLTWAASQAEAVAIPNTFTVDGQALSLADVKTFKKLFIKKGERVFTAGTASAAEQAQLAYLLSNGYTLSRQA